MSLTLTLVAILTTRSVLAWSKVEIDESVTDNKPSPCHPCICSVNYTVANCSHRGLQGIPNTLPNSITVLLMDYNNISRLSSNDLSKFENLTQLYIANNTIKDVMDDAFQGLNHLRCLHMEGNQVQCPSKALSVLQSLEELYLDGSINMTFDEHFKNVSKLTHLSVSGHLGNCHLTNLFNHTFKNVPYLKILDVSFCHLYNIDPGTFLPLRDIYDLDISANFKLTFKNFKTATYGLRNSSIRILRAGGIVEIESICNVLCIEHTQYLEEMKLEKLYFDYNRLEMVGPGVLSHLPPTLWFISARYNRFTYSPYVKEIRHMTSVTHLYLGNDESKPIHYNIPPVLHTLVDNSAVCEMDSDSMCQSRLPPSEYNEHLSVSTHYFKHRHTSIYMPPHLQVLKITCGKLHFDVGWVNLSPNNITTLDLNCNLLSNWVGPVKGLEALKYLDLSNNIARNVSTLFFNMFPELKVLNISFNFLGSSLNTANMSHMFDNLILLEVLDMSLNDIYSLPENIFQDLVSVKTLNISSNVLFLNIPLRVANMKNLEVLDLSYNQIRTFSKVLMNELDSLAEFNNITIHMIHNPLSCTCSNLGFLKWMMSSKMNFTNMDNYTCVFDNQTFSLLGKFEDTITRLEQQCTNRLGLILGSVSAVVLSLVIISVALAYRYRWNLRYWYYAAKLRLKDQSLLDAEDDSFKFDAFVSYAEENKDFVTNEMNNRLNEDRIMLNIHERDFLPGKQISTNILSAIQGSRKTVVVLSRYFLESYWCMYELQMANIESIQTGRDVLIIIMYEDISTKEIPKEVLYHLKTESYIGYPHNGSDDQIDLFWRRLIAAIKNN